MTKIAIDIDCDGEYCGSCRKLDMLKNDEVPIEYYYICKQFIDRYDEYTQLTTRYMPQDQIKRCQQCLDATISEVEI